ncbi:quinone oxidoreductase family protein [Comamonas odontotermitis]|uniref:quinone oxidoreductase family protein n=1 Tax=Comamonas odontotermitis TaxID=379895 RepID=UPI001CC3D887|nr:quinone oxidoreductase [Comamonas odontotermitis]UBB19380.1 quinone oxidoreductase [Comamonas odontotermitis]
MAVAIRIHSTGAPDVMQMEEVHLSSPGPGEVLLAQTAIGVNPLDVSQRKGAVAIALPSGLGLEGAATVTAVGAGVQGLHVGDRVGYATGPLGAYASARVFPAERLVKLPDALGDDAAAAVLFKGITAQYLLKATGQVGQGSRVLIYGAAGALGQLMCAWAKHLGAHVLGVVSKAASVERARAAGCDEVFVFDAQTLAAQVAQATQGQKVDVVYDSIGKATFLTSLDCLRPRGLMVSLGATSGLPPAIEVGTLNAKGSLFLTRPSLAAHTATAEEYQSRARDVLSAVSSGILTPRIWKSYALAEVAQAHADLEQGRSQGAIVLKP